MTLRKPRFDRSGDEQSKRKVPSRGRYPQMVEYFRDRFQPRKESVHSFVSKAKRGHKAFLEKRGWSDEQIEIVWNEIIAECSRKSVRYERAVKELKRQGWRRNTYGRQT